MTKNDEIIKRSGTKFVCELPKTDYTWKLIPSLFGIVCVTPDNPPYLLINNEVKELKLDDKTYTKVKHMEGITDKDYFND